MRDIMITKRSWDLLHNFEKQEKENFLRHITVKESFKSMSELYKFGYLLVDKTTFRKLNLEKIQVLAKVHSSFNRVKL